MTGGRPCIVLQRALPKLCLNYKRLRAPIIINLDMFIQSRKLECPE